MIDVLIAGSGNITGHGVAKALASTTWRFLGYDACDPKGNPANLFCNNERVHRAAAPEYATDVLDLVKRHRPQVIIPSNDHDLRALLSIHEQLRSLGCTINGHGPHSLTLLDKQATSNAFRTHGIESPRNLDFP